MAVLSSSLQTASGKLKEATGRGGHLLSGSGLRGMVSGMGVLVGAGRTPLMDLVVPSSLSPGKIPRLNGAALAVMLS